VKCASTTLQATLWNSYNGKTEAAMSRLSSLLSDVAWLLLLVCVLPVAIIVIGLPFAAIARLIHALVSRLL
jgi:hypothetical protein